MEAVKRLSGARHDILSLHLAARVGEIRAYTAKAGKIFVRPVNLGTGREISIRDLILLIAELIGYQGRIYGIPSNRTANRAGVSIRIPRRTSLECTATTDFSVGL